jgi:hypothetical protein
MFDSDPTKEAPAEFLFPNVKDTPGYLSMSLAIFGFLVEKNGKIPEDRLYTLTMNYPYLQLIRPEVLQSLIETMESGQNELPEIENFSLDKVDDEDLAKMFIYAIDRLPEEFLDYECEVIFDCNYNPERNGGRHTTPKRNRGYFIEDMGEAGKRIVLEIRTITDLYENVSLLAALSSLRHRVREIRINQEDLSSTERLRGISDIINSSIYGRKKPIELNVFANQEFVLTGATGLIPSLEGSIPYATQSSIHATELVEASQRGLSPEDIDRPHIIFFANAFSYRNAMAQYLLEEKAKIDDPEGDDITLKDYLIGLADSMDPEIMEIEKVRRLRELIDTDINSNYLKRFAIISFLVTCLQDQGFVKTILNRHSSMPSNFKRVIENFEQTIKSVEFTHSIGLRTLVDADNSPTCEPVFYINPGLIDDRVLKSLEKFTQQALGKMREADLRIIMLPYALGELTGFIMQSLHGSFPNLAGVVELGKIGSLISYGERPVGKSVSVQLIHDDERLGGTAHHRILDYRDWAFYEQVPTVLNQSLGDFCKWVSDFRQFMLSDERQPNNNRKGWNGRIRHLTVGMEHRIILQLAVIKYKLPVFFSDFISDEVVGNARIHKGLGSQGALGAYEAFSNCMEVMAKYAEKRGGGENYRQPTLYPTV